jgi:hypothetical protein
MRLIIFLVSVISLVSSDLSSLLNYETLLPSIAKDVVLEFAKNVGPAKKNDVCREFAILLSEEVTEKYSKILGQVRKKVDFYHKSFG